MEEKAPGLEVEGIGKGRVVADAEEGLDGGIVGVDEEEPIEEAAERDEEKLSGNATKRWRMPLLRC